jgi:SAM-dependent methyltransferase
MSVTKQRAQAIVRRCGLLTTVERMRYVVSMARTLRQNKRFLAHNPDFAVPPGNLAFDAYAVADWGFYKSSGEATALAVADIARRFLPEFDSLSVLEWGCGPGRVIRHLPAGLGAGNDLFGSDFQGESIQWCRAHLRGASFVENSLQPPLPFDSGRFDFIYAISVFTHLSEATSSRWIEELRRVLRPGGVLLLTTQGDAFRSLLLPQERETYDSVGFVERNRYEEGKKMFAAYHSPDYLRKKLFGGWNVLKHAPADFPFTGQDTWVLGRPS